MPWLTAAAAIALAAAGHAPLWALRPVESAHPLRPTPRAPLVRYWPVNDDTETQPAETDLRVIWSPVLFSLPSRIGFRASEDRERLEFAPTAQIDPGPPVEIRLPDVVPQDGVVVLGPRPTVRIPPTLQPVATFPSAPRVQPAWQWEILDPQLRERLGELNLPLTEPLSARLTELTLWIRISEYGWPTQVLVDSVTPEGAADEGVLNLVQAIRQWRGPPGPETEGRLILRRVWRPTRE